MSAENITKNSGSGTAKTTTQKSSWPELVGKSGETAKATIQRERPDVEVILMDIKSQPAWTGDENLHRVRIAVDNGIVVAVPYVG